MPNIGPDREIHADRAAATTLTPANYHAIWEKWASEAIPGANEQRDQAVARMKECLENNAERLDLYSLDLTSLPDILPPCNALDLVSNKLTELPATLPNGLQKLEAAYNQLRTLPNTLPASLLSLDVCKNELERLPEPLPEGLKELDVGHNKSLQRPNRLPPNLETLEISNCNLTELPTLPNSLKKLDAHSNQLRILPDTLPALLSSLLVSRNRFTALPENLPGSLRCISAEDNQLSQLPDLAHLPQNCNILLDGNPFSTSTLQALQALQHLRIHPDYQGPRISCRELDKLPPVSLSYIVATWLPPEQQNSLAEDWAKIEQEANSGDFNVFLCRLVTTQNVKNIPEFKQQIAAWLLQLAGSFALREQTFLIAQEASATCEDRMTLTYNDMQKAVMLHEVEKGKYDTQLPELIARGREMFRLEQLEKIAREKVKTLNVHSVDEIEVYLAYQVKLRESLELSSVNKEMRFFDISDVTQGDLMNAETRVRTAENHDFSRWLSQWSPWKSVVQRIEPERYAAAVEKQYHALENIYPDKLAAELAANGMTGDVDANRIVGKRINDEIMEEIDMALTHEVLSAKGASSLLDNLWMESLISF